MFKRNKFIVTITDIEGSRNYVLNQIIKKILLYFLLVVVMAVILGALYINYIVTTTKEARNFLETENAVLLEAKMASQLELEIIEGKISELAEQYGIDSEHNISSLDIVQHIADVVLTGAEEKLMFSGIPNGYPTEERWRITDSYGERKHPILKHQHLHSGVDFGLPIGTPVMATADGVILRAEHQSGYGHLIEIMHNYGFSTRYAHLNGKYNVKVGDYVKKGDIISYSGNSGISTGPHLHYEVRFVYKPLDPVNFCNWSVENYGEIFQKEGRIPWQSLLNLLSITTNKQQQ